VNKVLPLFLFLFLITSCSLDQKSGLWTKPDKIENDKDFVIVELFKEEKKLDNELNSNVRIQLKSQLSKNKFSNDLSNNSGRVNYDGNLKTISKYKFSKIDNFNKFEPEMVFDQNNLIFFDNKGSILKFDQFSKLIWKKNYYRKSEKKLKPVLSMASHGNYLIVTDNLAKYYVIDIESGNLLWMKSNIAPFNSQIKVYKDNFFVTDFQNILRCYSIKDGEEVWNIKTDSSFIKSQKKLSLIISDEKVYFNNSIGDISAVDINRGKLVWQTPTQDSSIYESSFQLKTSDLVLANKSILFSNNTNEFYSLDTKTGTLIWQQKINSTVRPTVIDNFVFTVTEEGFLVIIESETGNIIRITNVFDRIKEKKRSNIKPIGFVVGSKNIYLTTSTGRLITIDILTGKPILMIKVDNKNISRPFILDKKLFIIKDSAIIKLD
jgi:outer membrane protein assembly factor BamB